MASVLQRWIRNWFFKISSHRFVSSRNITIVTIRRHRCQHHSMRLLFSHASFKRNEAISCWTANYHINALVFWSIRVWIISWLSLASMTWSFSWIEYWMSLKGLCIENMLKWNHLLVVFNILIWCKNQQQTDTNFKSKTKNANTAESHVNQTLSTLAYSI